MRSRYKAWLAVGVFFSAISQTPEASSSSPGDMQPTDNPGLLAGACPPRLANPTELLVNPSFETVVGGRATNWIDNTWKGATVSYASVPGRAAGRAQKLTVGGMAAGAGVIVAQRFTFQPGITYEGRIWLRSDDLATVQFMLRREGPYYDSMAVHWVTLTPVWQEFVIRGGWHDVGGEKPGDQADQEDVPGYFGINFVTSGTVEIDDASLRQLTASDCVMNAKLLTPTFMGMTVNKWGSFTTWPSAQGFGLLRLIATTTTWEDLEPMKGAWDWFRMDYYVDAARAANQEILYTLGMTPLWASARPGESGAEPASLADWRNYVRTVAMRYKGRIKYWEIWNEVNIGDFYTGSVDTMIELTRAASEELKAIDPTNVVLSPNVSRIGLAWLDEFLAKGGGSYVDIISWHLYTNYQPELDEPVAAGLRDVLARRGMSDRPIWNTEGNIVGTPVSAAAAVGAVARAYLVQPWWGHSNFTFYCWDIDFGNPLSQPGYLAPTPAGIAYREVAAWLRGAKMRARTRAVDGTWQVALEQQDGTIAYVVWNEGNRSFPLPASWAVTTQRDLAGGSQPIVSRTVDVGPAPVLLVP